MYHFVEPWRASFQEIAEFLTGHQAEVADDRVLATVLFTDIVDSTRRAAEIGDRDWHALLDAHDAVVRAQLARFRGREVNTSGDGFLAMFDGPQRAIRCAMAIRDAVQALGIEVRAGLHTGECEVRGDDIGGIAVHIGARVSALAGANDVLVSSTLRDLVIGSGLEFEERGSRAQGCARRMASLRRRDLTHGWPRGKHLRRVSPPAYKAKQPKDTAHAQNPFNSPSRGGRCHDGGCRGTGRRHPDGRQLLGRMRRPQLWGHPPHHGRPDDRRRLHLPARPSHCGRRHRHHMPAIRGPTQPPQYPTPPKRTCDAVGGAPRNYTPRAPPPPLPQILRRREG